MNLAPKPVRSRRSFLKPMLIVAIVFIVALAGGFMTARLLQQETGIFGNLVPTESAEKSQTLQGVLNFRTVEIPGKMKSGILYRSTRLSGATKSDVNRLAKLLDSGAVIDLRSKLERKIASDPSIAGVPNKSFPIAGAASANGYVGSFVNNADSRKQFGAALAAIANAKGNVLVHCTYGKDRTGWLVAMVMHSLGANDQQVLTEYLKSNNQVKGGAVEAGWLNAGLAAAREKYGSIENYIRDGLGVNESTLVKLQGKFRE